MTENDDLAADGDLFTSSDLALRRRDVEIEQLLTALGTAQLPDLTGWFSIQKIKQSASSVFEDGWKFSRFDPVLIAELSDWAQYGVAHRSWGFHLHAWEFMDPLLRAADDEDGDLWLRRIVQIAVGWIRIHRGADDEADPMAWYDMSQSLRMPRLIAITLRAARHGGMREQTVILAEALAWHLDELHQDRAFNPRNNHGFYTAVSQVHAGRHLAMLPDAPRTAEEGAERLALMARSQFAADGVHLEHSPDYHRMLLNSFELAVRDDLIADEEIRQRIQRAAHVLGWMIQPDGAIVQMGDSPETNVLEKVPDSIDPHTRFLLTDGASGEPMSEELAAFAEGGYAFVRSPQPTAPGEFARSGYLAFSAAYHSRAHKHADDLNVVWYDRGQQILTDAGRFGYGELLDRESPLRAEGYYYAAPERQYVESTMAHNTLMVDGRNQRRQGRKPYGSALTDCVRKGDRFDLSARVRHPDYVHRRRVVYTPGKELRLLDAIHSRLPEPREAVVWLNIDGSFELESVGEEIVLRAETVNGPLRLGVSGPGRALEPVRGQHEPLRGWRSRTDGALDPTWSLGFTFPLETRASVETRLHFL
ncbi:heparinase II/III family protein [Brachybacterium sp. FME24]|uniref:heparinase II/III domain-containing protein n=1 Tax=Brachybacterium sp. FME24 TaxID=2742605 RepID=UPI001868000D|nr:heparinase II/III family protein [Brachybacterium sp. FME24]